MTPFKKERVIFYLRGGVISCFQRVHSFNGKTSHSKREVLGSSPSGPAKIMNVVNIFLQGAELMFGRAKQICYNTPHDNNHSHLHIPPWNHYR